MVMPNTRFPKLARLWTILSTIITSAIHLKSQVRLLSVILFFVSLVYINENFTFLAQIAIPDFGEGGSEFDFDFLNIFLLFKFV